jgi:rSAM/selenodomain-associated transferase 1
VKKPILVIIAKEPQIGTTKTRLSPPLDLAEAAELFEALLADTIALASSVKEVDLAVAVTPPESIGYFERKTPLGTILIPVTCDNIGDCLLQVFDELFQRGYPKVLAFNSDGPSLPKEYIHLAVRLLDDHDLVFGPSEDGGYYLVGSKELFSEIFTGIKWSTPEVLERSIAKAEVMNLQIALLPEWYDVDTERDIKRLLKEIHDFPSNQLENTKRFFEGLPSELKSSLFDLKS